MKICVPTTAGTGSEVTRTAIVTNAAGNKVWLWGDELKADEVLLDPELTVDRERILAIVERELSVSAHVWQGYRLLDRPDTDEQPDARDDRPRVTNRNIEHVFALLATVVPREPLSSMILADGSTVKCLIIDMSRSGVAVSAGVVPDIGTPLAVGKLIGRVIRHFKGGFAVEFVDRQQLGDLERLLIKPLVEPFPIRKLLTIP